MRGQIHQAPRTATDESQEAATSEPLMRWHYRINDLSAPECRSDKAGSRIRSRIALDRSCCHYVYLARRKLVLANVESYTTA